MSGWEEAYRAFSLANATRDRRYQETIGAGRNGLRRDDVVDEEAGKVDCPLDTNTRSFSCDVV
jgi:hypothetical protein